MRGRRTIQGLAALALLAASTGALAQVLTPAPPAQSSPAPPQPPMVALDTALHIAIERLREEGRQFRSTGNLPRQQPDFAETFTYFVRPADVIEAISSVQEADDAAVDGYIRWQLLSFDLDLAGMDGPAYDRLIANLPRLTRSAAADVEVHGVFERLAIGAGRNADVKAELEQRWDALRFQDSHIELLNQPAIKFRDLVADAMPETGARRLGVLLLDLQGRIAAACDSRALKTRVTRTLRERVSDETISTERRWELIKYIEGLPGPASKVVRDVVFYATEPADVRYTTYAIRSSDVKKWTAYLNRHEP